MAGEKTEKATPKRREDERKKGHVFQSRDVTIAFSLIVMFVALRLLGGYIYQFLRQLMAFFFSGAGNMDFLSLDSLTQLSIYVLSRLLVLVLPLLLISVLSSFLLTGIQTRFIFSTKQMAVKWSRLNPINGFKRTLSIRSLFQLIKSLLMIVVVSTVIVMQVKEFTHTLGSFYFMPVSQSIPTIASFVFSIFIKVCGVIVLVGVLDFFMQWWQHEKDMRMSKQEIKDEYKLIEGNPQIKSAIRSRQQKMAQMRMMQRVPEADVIIVNPEHFAVALQYDDKRNRAPVVIAKGTDFIALKIKDIAKKHDILIEENPPLARALYKAVEIDKEIPPEFYQAVAEVLSYIYRIKKRNINHE